MGGRERKSAEHLEKEIERSGLQDLVDNVLVPVRKEIVTRNNKRKEVEKLLFPSYVLIHAELTGDLEYIIRNLIPGMYGFLTERKRSQSDKSIIERVPVPIRDDEAARILGQQDKNLEEATKTEVNFDVNDSVKITDGPFNGFTGTVEQIDADRSKLKVVVVIFGRKTLLELSFTQVTKE